MIGKLVQGKLVHGKLVHGKVVHGKLVRPKAVFTENWSTKVGKLVHKQITAQAAQLVSPEAEAEGRV